MFYDEDLVIDLRLNILNEYVHKFVIVESKFTHSGKKRELLFDINKYSKFKNKINYIVLENEPIDLERVHDNDTDDKKNSKYIMNALKRENFQRNGIKKGLTNAKPDDLILVSDVDEIPNLLNLDINEINDNIILFKQNFYYYKFNLKLEDMPWLGTKGCKYKNLKSPQWLRNIKDKKYPFWRLDVLFSDKKYSNIKFIDNGGWHFSNMKTPEEIEKKMRTYLHHREYDIKPLGTKKIEEMIKSKKSIYNLRADMKNEKIDGTQNLENVLTTNISKAYLNLKLNEEKIISSFKEIESSKESVRLSRLRYDVGISTLKDVLIRQSELSNAKSKNINAFYNYNLNLDELERLTFLEISKNCLDNNNNKDKESICNIPR